MRRLFHSGSESLKLSPPSQHLKLQEGTKFQKIIIKIIIRLDLDEARTARQPDTLGLQLPLGDLSVGLRLIDLVEGYDEGDPRLPNDTQGFCGPGADNVNIISKKDYPPSPDK
jgi:hypothetical protein